MAVLEDLRSKVRTAQPWATDVGPSLLSWYIDQKAQKLVIGLDHLTSTFVSDAQKAFGDLAQLTIAGRVTLLDNRLFDPQPYKGSDRLIGPGGSCTAGFPVVRTATGTYGWLTAGHCWREGDVVKQGDDALTTGTVGTVSGRIYGNYDIDVEFIDRTAVGSSLSPLIWYGPTSPPLGTLAVHGAGTSFLGMGICADGSYTGENCSGVVDATDGCYPNSDNIVMCHLDRVHSSNGTMLAQLGDSGGPVEAHDAQNGVTVYGTISAIDQFNKLYFTEIKYELDRLTAALEINHGTGTALWPNQYLIPNQSLVSDNGAYKLIMQGDGNLVLYSTTGVRWNSGTWGNYDVLYAVMQGDGNFVIYKQGGIAIWNSGTQRNPGAWLQLNGDGVIAIYKPGSIPIWHRP
jgi:hypothetical protein